MISYLDVCAGISASTVAWKPMGWRAAAYSEVDAAPRAVLAHHYPDVSLHGDFTTIGADDYGSIDLLVGGTPCQDFSVAGLRAGLDGDRGNLTLEFLRLAQRKRPRWIVWENVPGVLSIDGGRAFGAVLGGLAKLGYGFAYRILDAQFFGVPQRRRRVFVVAYLGDWRLAGAVLFERESLCGYPPPRGKARESVAGSLGGIAQEPGGGLISPSVTSKWSKGSGGPAGDEVQNLVAHSLRGEGFAASEDGTGRGTPLVAVPILEAGARTGVSTTDLRAGIGVGEDGDAMFTLQAGKQHAVGVVGTICRDSFSGGAGGRPEGAAAGHFIPSGGSGVRRLTPRECERLQGFPDDYTLAPYRGKEMSDGPRYKMLGNSMAVPVMGWIGHRIQLMEEILRACR